MCTVLFAGAAVGYSCVDFIVHVGQVQPLSHRVVYSTLAQVPGQKGVMTNVKPGV